MRNKRKIQRDVFFRFLFRQFITKFGVLFFVASSLFCIPFDVSFNDTKFSDDSPVVKGKVTEITSTSSSVGNRKIYEYSYVYFVAGEEFKNKSYKPASFKHKRNIVSVEYLPDNPSVSRIKGMTIGVFPFESLFLIYLFQFAGIVMFLIGFIGDAYILRIYRIGKVAIIKIISTEEIVSQRSYIYFKLVFSFDAKGKKYQSKVNIRYEELSINAILYNPKRPKRNILVDSLPDELIKLLKSEIREEKLRIKSF